MRGECSFFFLFKLSGRFGRVLDIGVMTRAGLVVSFIAKSTPGSLSLTSTTTTTNKPTSTSTLASATTSSTTRVSLSPIVTVTAVLNSLGTG